MTEPKVNPLAKYFPLAVETYRDDMAEVVDGETLAITIARLTGPKARERAEAIVYALNRSAAVVELAAKASNALDWIEEVAINENEEGEIARQLRAALAPFLEGRS